LRGVQKTGPGQRCCANTILRGDVARLTRTADVMTGSSDSMMPRCKPLMYCYEKDIVMYAHLNKLDYFSTECLYSPNAYRGRARELIKQLEACNHRLILDIIHSAGQLTVPAQQRTNTSPLGKCSRCGYMSNNEVCKACVLLEGLRKGQPHMAIGGKKKQKELSILKYE